jgi:hypothetical protein
VHLLYTLPGTTFVWESHQRRQVEIDWDGLGLFANPYTDVTQYVLDVECFRGRDEPNTLRGRCEPGTLRMVLENRSGAFSPVFPTSPLYGLLLPGRRVRFGILTPITFQTWQGKIINITQSRWGGLPVAIIEARGPLLDIADVRVSPPADTGALTGAIITKILDAAAYSASLRTLDAGQTTTSQWYVNDRPALDAGRDMEEAELGLLSESPAGHIVYRDRAHRLSGARLVSQATFSDAPGATYPFTKIEMGDPNKNIVNVVRSTVTPYSTAALADLWTLTGETPTIGPGQTKTWYAEVSGNTLYVAAWTTPVSGTDYTVGGVALGDLSVVVVKAATTMKISITNNHATNVATITLLKARGTAVTAGTPTTVEGTNAASVTKYGSRTYQLASPWLPNTNAAQSYVDSLLAAHKDPQPPVYVTFAAINDTVLAQIMAREIHDRVTVLANQARTGLGLAGDFFIESIGHHWDVQSGRQDVTFGLSPVIQSSGAWILGTSVLGTSTYLGF